MVGHCQGQQLRTHSVGESRVCQGCFWSHVTEACHVFQVHPAVKWKAFSEDAEAGLDIDIFLAFVNSVSLTSPNVIQKLHNSVLWCFLREEFPLPSPNTLLTAAHLSLPLLAHTPGLPPLLICTPFAPLLVLAVLVAVLLHGCCRVCTALQTPKPSFTASYLSS